VRRAAAHRSQRTDSSFRGDFQYRRTRVGVEEIIENTKHILDPGTTIYIATDERNKTFFDPLKGHYDVKFMDDFKDLLEGINSNYYGMIDQVRSFCLRDSFEHGPFVSGSHPPSPSALLF